MIQGFLRVVDDAQLQRIHEGALCVLERTGLQIRGRFLMQALADAGCRVDFARCRAWFKPDLVARQEPVERDAAFVRELDRIVLAARDELLS